MKKFVNYDCAANPNSDICLGQDFIVDFSNDMDIKLGMDIIYNVNKYFGIILGLKSSEYLDSEYGLNFQIQI